MLRDWEDPQRSVKSCKVAGPDSTVLWAEPVRNVGLAVQDIMGNRDEFLREDPVEFLISHGLSESDSLGSYQGCVSGSSGSDSFGWWNHILGSLSDSEPSESSSSGFDSSDSLHRDTDTDLTVSSRGSLGHEFVYVPDSDEEANPGASQFLPWIISDDESGSDFTEYYSFEFDSSGYYSLGSDVFEEYTIEDNYRLL